MELQVTTLMMNANATNTTLTLCKSTRNVGISQPCFSRLSNTLTRRPTLYKKQACWSIATDSWIVATRPRHCHRAGTNRLHPVKNATVMKMLQVLHSVLIQFQHAKWHQNHAFLCHFVLVVTHQARLFHLKLREIFIELRKSINLLTLSLVANARRICVASEYLCNEISMK